LKNKLSILISMVILYTWGAPAYSVASQGDLVLDNVYEIAEGRPCVYYLIRRDLKEAPLMDDLGFAPERALLDTGASAISIARSTATRLGLRIEPQACFIEVGVGGEEKFSVSEPVSLGLAGYDIEDPEDPCQYRPLELARFEIAQGSVGFTFDVQDVIGMPVMLGKVVVLETGRLSDSGQVAAQIRPFGDPNLLPCDFAFKLRMQQFNNIQDKRHVPPLPTLAANPVIDQVVLQHQGKTSTATWLLDTGGRISLISKRQAQRLGLLDTEGKQLARPVFSVAIGGVGRTTMMPMYQINRLVIPEVSGHKIMYVDACVGVHDITYTDPETQSPRVLDGVFGCNFFCPATRLPGLLPMGAISTPFEQVVIDFSKEQVGLRVQQKRK
jgi:hypothetical protein